MSAPSCAVCGRAPAVRRETLGGTFYGNACDSDPCPGLLWEAHFIKATNGSTYDHELVLWHWRKRRADVDRRTFLEPLPTDPRDVAGERLALELEARLELPVEAA